MTEIKIATTSSVFKIDLDSDFTSSHKTMRIKRSIKANSCSKFRISGYFDPLIEFLDRDNITMILNKYGEPDNVKIINPCPRYIPLSYTNRGDISFLVKTFRFDSKLGSKIRTIDIVTDNYELVSKEVVSQDIYYYSYHNDELANLDKSEIQLLEKNKMIYSVKDKTFTIL